jgi:hypothetical protein
MQKWLFVSIPPEKSRLKKSTSTETGMGGGALPGREIFSEIEPTILMWRWSRTRIISRLQSQTIRSCDVNRAATLRALNVKIEPATSGWKSVKPEAVKYRSISESSNA